MKLLLDKPESLDPSQNVILRLARKAFPMTQGYEGTAFFIRRKGHLLATPLFLALLMAETTDVLFAVDSIPAVFTVTRNPFIAYTSNVLAMLGLRSLYFLLAGALVRLRYLRTALSCVLVFPGSKMLLERFYPIPVVYSLLVIAIILGLGVVASLRAPATHASSARIA